MNEQDQLKAMYPTMFRDGPAPAGDADAELRTRYPTMFSGGPAAPTPAPQVPTSAPPPGRTAAAGGDRDMTEDLAQRYPSMAPTPADTARAAARAAAEADDAAALRQRYPRMAPPSAAKASAGEGAPPTEAEALAARFPRMAPQDAVAQAIEPGLVRVAVAHSLDDAATAAIRAAALDLARDLGADAAGMAELVSLYAEHAGAVTHDDLVADWDREAMAQARLRFGDGLNARLARVQAYVEARPELHTMLLETGLGSHPRWVLALLEAADRLPSGKR